MVRVFVGRFGAHVCAMCSQTGEVIRELCLEGYRSDSSKFHTYSSVLATYHVFQISLVAHLLGHRYSPAKSDFSLVALVTRSVPCG